MLHTDMAIIDSMVAARQEQMATTMWDSHHPGPVVLGLGSLLIRLGQWMKNEPAQQERTAPVIPAKRRPQLA